MNPCVRVTAQLGAMLLLVSGLSCVLPAPVAIESEINNHPFIAIESTRPPLAAVELNLNCFSCTFSIQVEDPDLGDELSYRWFLDFDSDTGTEGLNCDGTIQAPSLTFADREPVTCELNLAQRFPDPSDDGSFHTLEAWVSDRPPEPNANVRIRRGFPEDANIVQRQWTVVVRSSGVGCTVPQQMSCRASPQ